MPPPPMSNRVKIMFQQFIALLAFALDLEVSTLPFDSDTEGGL